MGLDPRHFAGSKGPADSGEEDSHHISWEQFRQYVSERDKSIREAFR